MNNIYEYWLQNKGDDTILFLPSFLNENFNYKDIK